MKRTHRTITTILLLALLLTVFPTNALAADSGTNPAPAMPAEASPELESEEPETQMPDDPEKTEGISAPDEGTNPVPDGGDSQSDPATDAGETVGGTDEGGESQTAADEAPQNSPPLRSDSGTGPETGSPPVIITQPSSQTVPYNGVATLTVTASGDSLSYQWQWGSDNSWWDLSDNSAYQGTTTNTLQVINPDPYSTIYYRYRCIVSNAEGQTISDSVSVSSYYKPEITSRTSYQYVVDGGIATFKITAVNGTLTYRWQVSKDKLKTWEDTDETGCTTNTLQVAATKAKNGYYYRCIATNAAGSTTTYACKLVVYYQPEITYQPVSKAAVAGRQTSFTVHAEGGALKYQWQVSKNDGKTWENTGGTARNLIQITVSEEMDGYRYRCVISNAAGQITSQAANLTVLTKPVITVQPSNRSAASGKTATFAVTATGGNLKYRWEVSKDGGATWAKSVFPGSSTRTLTATGYKSMDGYLYRCTVSNAAGSVTTRNVKFTVLVKPVITVQPSAKSVISGNTAFFTVYATGGNLKYQWEVSRDGGATWTKSVFPGNTTNTLTVTGYKALDGSYYRCVISNSAQTITTKRVKLTVLTKPVITVQPKAKTVSAGGTVTFTVSATGGDLRYQWYVNKVGDGTFEASVSAGNTTNSLTVRTSKSMNGYCYWCIISNAAGMTVSNSVKLTVLSG